MKETKNQRGFNLIELLIVVCIFGLLTNLASVQYSSFLAKARMIEVKVRLPDLAKVELTYLLVNKTYTSCIKNIIKVGSEKRRYSLGMTGPNGDGDNQCGPWKNGDCRGLTYNPVGADDKCSYSSVNLHRNNTDEYLEGFYGTTIGGEMPGGSVQSGRCIGIKGLTDEFRLCAAGAISSNPAHGVDRWVIDQTLTLTHLHAGWTIDDP